MKQSESIGWSDKRSNKNNILRNKLIGNRLGFALRYAKLGWSVIPVNSKIPFMGWKPFQQRIASESEIRSWWRKYFVRCKTVSMKLFTSFFKNFIPLFLSVPILLRTGPDINLGCASPFLKMG